MGRVPTSCRICWRPMSVSCWSFAWFLAMFVATDSAMSWLVRCFWWSTVLEKQSFMASCSGRVAFLTNSASMSRVRGVKFNFFSMFSGSTSYLMQMKERSRMLSRLLMGGGRRFSVFDAGQPVRTP